MSENNEQYFSEEEFTEKHLERMSELSKIFGKAKGELAKLDLQRKALKAVLMKEAEIAGATSIQKQERDAYADERFWTITEAIGNAQRISSEAWYSYDIFKIRFEKWRTERADFRSASSMR